jgi:hypothetical protein
MTAVCVDAMNECTVCVYYCLYEILSHDNKNGKKKAAASQRRRKIIQQAVNGIKQRGRELEKGESEKCSTTRCEGWEGGVKGVTTYNKQHFIRGPYHWLNTAHMRPRE